MIACGKERKFKINDDLKHTGTLKQSETLIESKMSVKEYSQANRAKEDMIIAQE